ncbi:MAG: fumarate hydratase [Clostridia bacterium]|nr:fumarate hydratase [Clostridia bacterium]
MKKISVKKISQMIEQLCIEACCVLNDEVIQSYKRALDKENNPLPREIMNEIISNAALGNLEMIPVCQDTGMVIVFVTIGDQVTITDGNIEEAINLGIKNGYEKGYLRKSVVSDPIKRVNTGDNTPAVIYYEFVKGDLLKIDVMPKGFGSENMSSIKMLKPSDGLDGVKSFILETVVKAGPNACPPLFLGIGIGGTMDKAAVLSKKALLRNPGSRNNDDDYNALEIELKESINLLNIGPAGLKGKTTVLDVFIESFPTHIAGLPVAVTICCHSLRHKGVIL